MPYFLYRYGYSLCSRNRERIYALRRIRECINLFPVIGCRNFLRRVAPYSGTAFAVLKCFPPRCAEKRKGDYMVKYILKRLLYLVFVFFIVSIIMFGIYKCVPGDPARMMIDSSKQTVDPERYEQMYQNARERLGLNDPIPVQYVKWVGNMLTGDFGFSSQYRRPVADIVAAPIGNTVMLNIASMLLVFLITIPLGIITACLLYTSPSPRDTR